MYTCPCEVGCKNVKLLTTNCVSISVSLSERISLFNCKKSCPLLTSKLLSYVFISTKSLGSKVRTHVCLHLSSPGSGSNCRCWKFSFPVRFQPTVEVIDSEIPLTLSFWNLAAGFWCWRFGCPRLHRPDCILYNGAIVLGPKGRNRSADVWETGWT